MCVECIVIAAGYLLQLEITESIFFQIESVCSNFFKMGAIWNKKLFLPARWALSVYSIAE